MLGADWEEQILNKRLEIVEKFKNAYIGMQKEIAQNTIAQEMLNNPDRGGRSESGISYNRESDYTALIQEAIKNGDFATAAILEQQRNAKIHGEGLGQYQETNRWQDWVGGSGVGYDPDFDYTAAISEAIARGDYESAARLEKQRNAKIEGEGLPYEKTYKYQSDGNMDYSSFSGMNPTSYDTSSLLGKLGSLFPSILPNNGSVTNNKSSSVNIGNVSVNSNDAGSLIRSLENFKKLTKVTSPM